MMADRRRDRQRGGNRDDRSGPVGQGQTATLPARPGAPPPRPQGGIYLTGSPRPDPNITAAEDALVATTRDQEFEGMPGRRSYGTLGKQIALRTNYFNVRTPHDKNPPKEVEAKAWYRYDVAVNPEPSKTKRRRMMEEVVKLSFFTGKTWATDYGSIVITTEKLDLGTDNRWMGKILIPPPEGDTQEPGGPPAAAVDRNTVQIAITYQDSFSLQHIMEFLTHPSAGAIYAGRETIVQLLNIIMCKPPQSNAKIAKVGGNKFYPFEGHPGFEQTSLGAGLQALRGYYTSVRPTINRLLVNVNVTSGAFYNPVPLLQLMQEANYSLTKPTKHAEAFVHFLKVRVEYKDKAGQVIMSKTKVIRGFAREIPQGMPIPIKRFASAKQARFMWRKEDGEEVISVADYFKRHHEITLKSPDLAVVDVGSQEYPQYVPPEFCTVLPGQPYHRVLEGETTSAMIKFAARFPNLNAMSIVGTPETPGNGLRIFRLTGEQFIQRRSVHPFGFCVDPDMIVVPGRILKTPVVQYKEKKPNVRNGSWNIAGQRFSTPGRHGQWQILVFNLDGRNTLRADNEEIAKDLDRILKEYGLVMGTRSATQYANLERIDQAENRFNNEDAVRDAFKKANDRGVRTLLIVLPRVHKWLYTRIKYHGDITFGIHTIAVTGANFQKGDPMTYGNLALKFNIKGGGISHKVIDTLSAPLDNNTMLVGIDVTHPSPGSSRNAPSIACVVANYDEHLIQWPGSIRTQTGRQEMVSGLEEMVLERLDLWVKKNKKLPGKIVLYRDGVSEGQYLQVINEEIPPFQAAFTKRYGARAKWPKLSVLVVGKRHHTRFYPTSQEDASFDPQKGKGSWNPTPGTVVDRGIANRIFGEFWLQAHAGLQGTARPAHYVILKDEIKFEADQLERITHNMCYLFNRATKAVSICPPAYYADLLCERGRAYLHSTLAEQTFENTWNAAEANWTGGVHVRLRETTFYI